MRPWIFLFGLTLILFAGLAGAETRVPEPIVVKGDGPFFEFKTKDTMVE